MFTKSQKVTVKQGQSPYKEAEDHCVGLEGEHPLQWRPQDAGHCRTMEYPLRKASGTGDLGEAKCASGDRVGGVGSVNDVGAVGV